MAKYTVGSFTKEEIAETQYLLQSPQKREEAISSLLENPRETYLHILGLILEVGEKDWPICSKVHVFSNSLDFVKSQPKLIQCAGEDRIKVFEGMLERLRKKLGPHTRGCSMCDPGCFAPPMQYFSTCSMLAKRTGF